jgi:hypothetical protein
MNETTSITINIAQEQEQKARNLIKRFTAANNEFVSVANDYALEVAKDPYFKEFCIMVGFSSCTLNEFLSVANKTMHPDLLFLSGTVKSVLKKLPYSEQTRILEAGKVEVLSSDGTVLNVALDDLTEVQRKLVFNNGSIRSISAQKAYIESQKIEQQIKTAEAPVYVNYRWAKREGKEVLLVGSTEYRWEDVRYMYDLYIDKLGKRV